ncbi:methyl-accepting chemotaxis protein [Acidimangrovimonas sediminis]|uniref:methyl-accepting chemotaxis protein n=1 Tax=Acidimangrovimonas sediminis TaxID=2056283 RepID=UPI000C7FC60F|nr:methyl-accepting chemotaxis protein [Acidimangrovimonas sediminis]
MALSQTALAQPALSLQQTVPPSAPLAARGEMDGVALTATQLGRDIVEIGGALDRVDAEADAQIAALRQMRAQVAQLRDSTGAMGRDAATLAETSDQARGVVQDSIALLQASAGRSRTISEWVAGLAGRMEGVGEELDNLGASNQQIAEIARQVRMLAINAKIEAARAGVYGLGFGVVAEEIGRLANNTAAAAEAITGNLGSLRDQIGGMRGESAGVAQEAGAVLTEADKTDRALGDMADSVRRSAEAAAGIAARSEAQSGVVEAFLPAFERIDTAAGETAARIATAHASTNSLLDRSEALVQQTARLGGVTAETLFIETARATAAEIATLFEAAIARGEIPAADLFSDDYRPIPGSDPAQVRTAFTAFTDRHLPALQEPVLDLDPRVIFCAAVDRNGYLPTHNRKFSHPQGDDPVWNATHCRNRRIFDDRVGLKAGRSAAPFLLQVYRRDMGGGNFVVMKDVSAPITVNGRHWGGLRIAYGF